MWQTGVCVCVSVPYLTSGVGKLLRLLSEAVDGCKAEIAIKAKN